MISNQGAAPLSNVKPGSPVPANTPPPADTTTTTTATKDILGDIPQVASGGFAAHTQFLANFKRDIGQIRARISRNQNIVEETSSFLMTADSMVITFTGDFNTLQLSNILFSSLRYANALHRIRKHKEAVAASAQASAQNQPGFEPGSKVAEEAKADLEEYTAIPNEGKVVIICLNKNDWRCGTVTSVDQQLNALEVLVNEGLSIDVEFDQVKNKLKKVPKPPEPVGNLALAAKLEAAFDGFKAVLGEIERTNLEGAQDLEFMVALKARAQRHKDDRKKLQDDAGQAAIRAEFTRKLQEDIEFEEERKKKEEQKLSKLEAELKIKGQDLQKLEHQLRNQYLADDSPEARNKRLTCRLLSDEVGDLTIDIELAKEEIKDIKGRIKTAKDSQKELEGKPSGGASSATKRPAGSSSGAGEKEPSTKKGKTTKTKTKAP